MEELKIKSSTQRSREYRERLKAEGGKELSIRLSPNEAKAISLVKSLYFGGDSKYQDGDVLKAVFLRVALKAVKEATEADKLKKDLGTDEDTARFYLGYCRKEFETGSPSMTAEKFKEHKRIYDESGVWINS